MESKSKIKLKFTKPDLSKYSTVTPLGKAVNVHIAEELKRVRIESCIHLQAMSRYYHATKEASNLSQQKDEE